jgi:hypothetical protein
MADSGSVISPFQFLSYKIDSVDLKMDQRLRMLSAVPFLKPERMNVRFRFKQPVYSQESDIYVVSFETLVLFFPDEIADIDAQNPPVDKASLSLEVSIAGIFSVNERLPEETEANLVKIHAPAVLMPYVRSTVSAVLGICGFGSIPFPLINIHQVAKAALAKARVQIID